jgi:hypothetical protein
VGPGTRRPVDASSIPTQEWRPPERRNAVSVLYEIRERSNGVASNRMISLDAIDRHVVCGPAPHREGHVPARRTKLGAFDVMTLLRIGRADAGSPPQSHELLIIARARADFFSVVQRFPDAASLEVHLDRRRGQRRRSADPAAASEERRRRDRRACDISDQLRTDGWAFVPPSERTF